MLISFEEVIVGGIGRCLSWYLMSSYLYYQVGASVISDSEFDRLCVRLHEEFDALEHPHKHLVSKEALAAGTGYHIAEHDYPPIVHNAALWWLEEHEKAVKARKAVAKAKRQQQAKEVPAACPVKAESAKAEDVEVKVVIESVERREAEQLSLF